MLSGVQEAAERFSGGLVFSDPRPIVQYLARSVSALYAAFGSLTLLLAWDLRRFGPLVTWWGVTAILFALALVWVDTSAPMPAHWTWSECSYTLLTGMLVLILQRMATSQTNPSP